MTYVSYELKAMVAQNCKAYVSRNPWSLSSIGNISESCDSCSNFVRGHCVKEIFDDIAKTVTIN